MSWRTPTNDKALEYANRRVIFARDTAIEIPGLPSVRFLSKADGRRAVRDMMKDFASRDPQALTGYTDYASQGWGLADSAIRDLILEAIRGGQSLAPQLSAYSSLVAVAPPRRVSGPEKADHIFRDIAITMIVDEVAEVFGLKPTGRTGNRSASLVVAEALAHANIPMGYKQVEQIWTRIGKLLKPS
ncbi:hypothetical protein [Mesorhizobium sp. M1252]|uniref:hypothetical protein n=1 Tax=Mesorhizobium sp. M1252 TaxID=2957073 RepID=UPI0033367AB6